MNSSYPHFAHPRPKPSKGESKQAVGTVEREGSELIATYSPEDDKLRLYTGHHVDRRVPAVRTRLAFKGISRMFIL